MSRSFSFVPGPQRQAPPSTVRWLVWSFEQGRWRCGPAAMPWGAAAAYAESSRRFAEAISMESVNVR
jgi:hypothetical protein